MITNNAEMFSTDPVVRVKEASIFQDHNTILGDISFDIEKGEFVYLVGRTGSGKSSLLKTLYADLTLRLGDIQRYRCCAESSASSFRTFSYFPIDQ